MNVFIIPLPPSAYKSLEDSLEAELLQERLEVELEHLRREVMGENQLTGREEGEE